MRYCPLCNRQTLTVTFGPRGEPFVVVTCGNCGFVHRIADAGTTEIADARSFAPG